MLHRLQLFSRFCTQFLAHVRLVSEVLVGLIGLLLLGGVAIALVEELPLSDSIYFAFITGLTIGYGDIVPQTAIGRCIAIFIGVVGMIFIGLVVAVATRTLAEMADTSGLRKKS